MKNEILNYAQGLNASQEIIDWLEKKVEDNKLQTEVEHIIDYLIADNPKLKSATYEQVKSNCDKWLKIQIKKGNDIKETPKDIEVIKEWKKEGFKIIKLIGENAFKREGFLMSSCVASYYGKDTEIYSLRDKNNIPHATLEKGQQVKGKGNGSIHPKYVKYVIAFLEEIGMTVGDNEMKNLGYVNVEEIMKKEKDLKFPKLYQDKYFYKENLDKVENKDRISLWNVFGLFSFNSKLEVKFNFNIEKSVSFFRKKISKLKKKISSNEVAMANYNEVAMVNSNEVAMTDSNKVAMTNSNKVAMTDYNKVAMANSNKVAMANYNEVAMANYNKVAMTDSNKVAMANSNKVAMTDFNEVAMTDYNKVAMANYNKVAMANYNEVAMTDSNEVAMTDFNEVAMVNSNKVAMTNSNKVAMANYNKVAMANSNKVAMANSNEVAMANYNEVIAGEVCVLAGRRENKITIGNKSIAVMGNKSQIKGKLGSWIVLYERDNNYNIINVKTAKIDDKKIKENTWYELKNNKISSVIK